MKFCYQNQPQYKPIKNNSKSMNRLTLIVTFMLPVLLYGQGDLSAKVNEQLSPKKLPEKSWNDTTIGWSTVFQYHPKKRISKYFQCMHGSHLYEYVLTENKDKTLQLDRVIYLDSSGACFANIASLVNKTPFITKLLDYSVLYDSTFNILQINYRSPIVLKTQEQLLEAHENYLWEEMQFGQWLLKARETMLSGSELPVQNFRLSSRAQAYDNSLQNAMELDRVSDRRKKDSLDQVFMANHKTETDSCDLFYKEGQIWAVQRCLDCYTTLYKKYKYTQGELPGLRVRDLNNEFANLKNEIAQLIANADKAYKQENWDEALTYYQKCMEIDHTSQYALNQIEKIKQLKAK